MSALDEVLSKPTRRMRGCSVCGEPITARLMVQVRRVNSADSYYGKSRAAIRGMCDEHAAAVFKELEAELLRNRK